MQTWRYTCALTLLVIVLTLPAASSRGEDDACTYGWTNVTGVQTCRIPPVKDCGSSAISGRWISELSESEAEQRLMTYVENIAWKDNIINTMESLEISQIRCDRDEYMPLMCRLYIDLCSVNETTDPIKGNTTWLVTDVGTRRYTICPHAYDYETVYASFDCLLDSKANYTPNWVNYHAGNCPPPPFHRELEAVYYNLTNNTMLLDSDESCDVLLGLMAGLMVTRNKHPLDPVQKVDHVRLVDTCFMWNNSCWTHGWGVGPEEMILWNISDFLFDRDVFMSFWKNATMYYWFNGYLTILFPNKENFEFVGHNIYAYSSNGTFKSANFTSKLIDRPGVEVALNIQTASGPLPPGSSSGSGPAPGGPGGRPTRPGGAPGGPGSGPVSPSGGPEAGGPDGPSIVGPDKPGQGKELKNVQFVVVEDFLSLSTIQIYGVMPPPPTGDIGAPGPSEVGLPSDPRPPGEQGRRKRRSLGGSLENNLDTNTSILPSSFTDLIQPLLTDAFPVGPTTTGSMSGWFPKAGAGVASSNNPSTEASLTATAASTGNFASCSVSGPLIYIDITEVSDGNIGTTVYTAKIQHPEFLLGEINKFVAVRTTKDDIKLGKWYTDGCRAITRVRDTIEIICTKPGFLLLAYKDRDGPQGPPGWSTIPPFTRGTTSKPTISVFLGFPYNYELYIAGLVLRGISLLCLVITVLSYLIFKKARHGIPTEILLHLCISLIILNVVLYLAEVWAGKRTGCIVFNVLRYYFVLVSLLWNGIEAHNMYRMLVKVFNSNDTNHFVLKSAIISWGLPAVAVGIAFAASRTVFDGTYYNCAFRCSLRKAMLYYGWLIPMGVIMIHNLAIFVLVMNVLCRRKSIQSSSTTSRRSAWTNLSGALTMLVLLGVPWMFSAFGVIDAGDNRSLSSLEGVFNGVFVVCISLQGMFIFWFHCARVAAVREEWKTGIASHTRFTSLLQTSPPGSKKRTTKESSDGSKERVMVMGDKNFTLKSLKSEKRDDESRHT